MKPRTCFPLTIVQHERHSHVFRFADRLTEPRADLAVRAELRGANGIDTPLPAVLLPSAHSCSRTGHFSVLLLLVIVRLHGRLVHPMLTTCNSRPVGRPHIFGGPAIGSSLPLHPHYRLPPSSTRMDRTCNESASNQAGRAADTKPRHRHCRGKAQRAKQKARLANAHSITFAHRVLPTLPAQPSAATAASNVPSVALPGGARARLPNLLQYRQQRAEQRVNEQRKQLRWTNTKCEQLRAQLRTITHERDELGLLPARAGS